MFDSDRIEGIDSLRTKIPEKLQYWNRFGRVTELNFQRIFDEITDKYIFRIEAVLTDDSEDYSIKLSLINVTGKLSFDMTCGFYSGFAIEDCSELGYENNCNFRIYSLEQDISFELFCEKVKVELVE